MDVLLQPLLSQISAIGIKIGIFLLAVMLVIVGFMIISSAPPEGKL